MEIWQRMLGNLSPSRFRRSRHFISVSPRKCAVHYSVDLLQKNCSSSANHHQFQSGQEGQAL